MSVRIRCPGCGTPLEFGSMWGESTSTRWLRIHFDGTKNPIPTDIKTFIPDACKSPPDIPARNEALAALRLEWEPF